MNPTRLVLVALLCALGPAAPARAEDANATLARIAAEAEASGHLVLTGPRGWLFLAAELHHLGAGRFWGPDAVKASRAPKPEWADPLPAILDFRDQLAKAGVELWLVPVPPKAAVFPGEVPGLGGPPKGRLDAADVAFYALLAERGVTVLDLEPELAAAKPEHPTFCKTDSHWSGAGIELAAGRIAERVKKLPWYAGVPKQRFRAEARDVEITGDLARMLSQTPGEREKLPLRFVSEESGAPVEPSRASPVLLLGDSHTLVFHAGGDMHTTGAGLADQLAYELGFPVDLVGVRGSGATPARINLARRKDGLAGKKLAIWCFGAREFTEAAQGWAKVPVVR